MKKLPLAFGVLLAALSAAAPAGAVYQCGPDKDDCQCGMNDPYPCCDNGGNCTWWAWEQACCHWGVGLPGWGNANQWNGNAKADPKYDVTMTPTVGSIANRVSGSYGHVAWVTAVSGSNVTVTEQNCWGGWGHTTATRDKSYYDGGFIVRTNPCACQPGQTQTQSCGNCGQQTRTCNSSCQWDGWSACGGEGVCVPGQSEEQGCGGCGKHSRTCKSDCSWDAFGSCTSDPGFVPSECDTGKPGVCAKGKQQCVDGETSCVPTVEPSAEVCDWLDNDCDGVTDEGVCGSKPTQSGHDAGAPLKKADAGQSATLDDPGADALSGSSSCAISAGRARGGALASILLALLGAWSIRRARLANPRRR